jgi:hypothetical protein
MGEATCTARLKTGAGQFERLAESWARRVLRPTDQGFRRAGLLASRLWLLAPPDEHALVFYDGLAKTFSTSAA